MLFKKITYQGIMNYGRKKLSKSKGTSTNSTQTLNETQQWRKAKLSLKKRSVNPKFTLEVFL